MHGGCMWTCICIERPHRVQTTLGSIVHIIITPQNVSFFTTTCNRFVLIRLSLYTVRHARFSLRSLIIFSVHLFFVFEFSHLFHTTHCLLRSGLCSSFAWFVSHSNPLRSTIVTRWKMKWLCVCVECALRTICVLGKSTINWFYRYAYAWTFARTFCTSIWDILFARIVFETSELLEYNQKSILNNQIAMFDNWSS